MKIRGLIVLLAILLSMAPITGIAAAEAAPVPTLALANDYLQVSVNGQTGRFAIATKAGSPLKADDNDKPLLFQQKVPETSFTTFRINGKDYIYGNAYGFMGMNGQFTYDPTNQGLTNQSVWSAEGLEIVQTLTVVNDPTNPDVGNVKIAYEARNLSDKPVEVGARMLLDTMLGPQDASPVSLSGSNQFIQRETVVEGAMPYYWKAVDDPLAPKVTSYGFLSGWGNQAPDRLVFAHWNGISETKWDYEIDEDLNFTSKLNPYGTADSAAALYWEPASLAPAQTMKFETYYGLGSFYTSSKQAGYNLQVFAPQLLTLNAARDGYEESEFEIRAEMDNAIDGAVDLAHVSITLSLPESLALSEGEPQTRMLGELKKGDTATVSWKVNPQPQSAYKAAPFRVSVKAAGVEEVIQAKFVVLPALSGLPPEVQVMDISPNKLFKDDENKTVAVKGQGFEVLKSASDLQVQLLREQDRQGFVIPRSDIDVSDDNGMSIRLDDAVIPADFGTGTYLLHIDAGQYGTFEKKIELTADAQYRSRSYGLLLVVGDKVSTERELASEIGHETYSIVALENEDQLAELEQAYAESSAFEDDKQILLTIRGQIRAIKSGDEYLYEVQPGATINSIIRYDTSEAMKAIYGAVSQKLVVQKYAQDALHGGDYVRISGNGVLSIPSFPFMLGPFSIELTDGERFALEADEADDQLPVEIVWEVLGGLDITQKMGFLPVTIKNAVIGDQSVSFGGSLSLNFGALGGNNGSEAGAGSGGAGGSGGSGGGSGSGSGGGSGGSSGGGSGEGGGSPSDPLTVRLDVDEARFGIRKQDDLFGKEGDFGFLGLRAEGEAGMPDDLIPGMEIGARGLVLIDTIDQIYRIEVDVAFEVIEVQGTLTIRFTDSSIPIPDEYSFYIGGEPGIPLVPPVIVGFITGGGGGFSGLYDTVMGNFNILPPLELFITGAFDIEKVITGENLKFSFSPRGYQFSGDLAIVSFEILKNVHTRIQIEDSLKKFAASYNVGAELDVFDVLVGDVYFVLEFDSSKHGIFGPISLAGGGSVGVQVPTAVPVVGGLRLLNAEAGLSTEKVYAGVSVIGIPVSIEYKWGDDQPLFASNTLLPGMLPAHDPYAGLARKHYYDDETGEFAGTITYGSNIRKVGSIGPGTYAGMGKIASLGMLPIANSDRIDYPIPIGNQEMALLSFQYEGDQRPDLRVYGPGGEELALKEADEHGQNGNYRLQEIKAEESQSGQTERWIYVSLQQPEAGEWTVTSDIPLTGSVSDVQIPPSFQQLDVQQSGSHQVEVAWETSHADGKKVALYLSENNETDPGLKLVDGLDAEVGHATYTFPDTLASGDYYIKATLYDEASGTPYDSEYASGDQGGAVRIANPHEPAAPTNVQVTEAGNGAFRVQWDEADAEFVAGYFIEVLDGNGDPLLGPDGQPTAGVIEVTGGDQRDVLIGGAMKDLDGDQLGMPAGGDYRISVTAYKVVDEVKVFSQPTVSAARYLPKPDPADLELRFSAIEGELRSTDDGNGGKIALVNRNRVRVAMRSDQPVEADLWLNDVFVKRLSGEEWQEELTLQEGMNDVRVNAVNANGDHAVTAAAIMADTTAPDLKMESPEAAALTGDEPYILVKGMAETGSAVTVNGEAVESDVNGQFEKTVELTGVLSKEIRVVAEDQAGNQNAYTVKAMNKSVGAFERVEVRPVEPADFTVQSRSADGPATDEAFEIRVGQTQSFQLVGMDAEGNAYAIDNADVDWSVLLGEELVSMTAEGSLTANDPGDLIVKGSYAVSREYALEAVLIVKAAAAGGAGEDLPSYEDWYRPPADEDGGGSGGNDGNGGSGGNGGGTVGTPGSNGSIPGESLDDQLLRMLQQLIEQQQNVEFLTSASLSAMETTVIRIDGRAVLEIGKQSDGRPLGIGIGRVKDPSSYMGRAANLRLVGDIYEFKLDKPVKLDPPVSLVLRFDLERAGDLSKLGVYWYNEIRNRWEYVGGVVDPRAGTIRAALPHFSKFALLSDEDRRTFADLSGRWSESVVYRLASVGVVDGEAREGQIFFHPERAINRQEFAKLLVSAGEASLAPPALLAPFADGPEVAAWARSYMAAAVNEQWMSGTAKGSWHYLEPQRSISRAEAAALVGRMLEGRMASSEPAGGADHPVFRDAESIPSWASAHVRTLVEAGVITGYPDRTFRPNMPITREEAAAILSHALDVMYK